MADVKGAQLTVRGVSKRFGGVEALSGLSLSADPGEFVCVVGPSGCGKTTLLRIIAGLVTPTAGAITVGGSPVNGPGPDRPIVFQEDRLFPWRTAVENVTYGLELTGFESDVARRRARELLADVGLDDAVDRYPSVLSGGMHQRVGLARALAVEPLLLLLDEPFNSLDVQTRSRLHRLLLEVWRETRQTVVFVTHDIREAVTLADRIVVVSDQPGRVVDDVSIDLKRPRDTTGVAFNDVVRRLRSQLGVDR